MFHKSLFLHIEQHKRYLPARIPQQLFKFPSQLVQSIIFLISSDVATIHLESVTLPYELF